MSHGLRRDTTNQFEHPDRGLHAGMLALIVAEIGGFAVLFAGFVYAQLL
jgi:heme/copper-type cytochrome/quinol oxidase subunit 3